MQTWSWLLVVAEEEVIQSLTLPWNAFTFFLIIVRCLRTQHTVFCFIDFMLSVRRARAVRNEKCGGCELGLMWEKQYFLHSSINIFLLSWAALVFPPKPWYILLVPLHSRSHYSWVCLWLLFCITYCGGASSKLCIQLPVSLTSRWLYTCLAITLPHFCFRKAQAHHFKQEVSIQPLSVKYNASERRFSQPSVCNLLSSFNLMFHKLPLDLIIPGCVFCVSWGEDQCCVWPGAVIALWVSVGNLVMLWTGWFGKPHR